MSDDEILDEWHAAELAHAAAPDGEKQGALARIIAAEQAAIERFGAGPHTAAYDVRFPGVQEGEQ